MSTPYSQSTPTRNMEVTMCYCSVPSSHVGDAHRRAISRGYSGLNDATVLANCAVTTTNNLRSE